MQFWLSDQTRLIALVALCALLWSLESIVPLYRYQNSRVRHALPNVALTLILVLTNLALSFSSAYLAGFTVRHGVGVFFVADLSPWTQAVFGPLRLLCACPAAQVLARLAVPSRASFRKCSGRYH